MRSKDLTVLIADGVPLAEWWCQLNSYEWPELLPDPEQPTRGYNPRRSLIMRWIEDRIGIKECLRAWNRKWMTDEQFEEWWEKNHGAVESIQTLTESVTR